jgi:YVTN family beta-propeller protein
MNGAAFHLERLRPGVLRGRAVRATFSLGLACALLLLVAGSARGAIAYTAYVGNYGANTVTPVNTATNAAGTAIPVGTKPFAIAITPDSKTAYVANFGSNSITPINTANNAAGSAIAVGSSPSGIAITPDGKTAYVTNYGSNTVTPVSTATNAAGSPIAVGTKPWGIAITPDGRTAYVANSGANSVTVINVATNTSVATIAVNNPLAIAITPNGKTAYVAGNQTGQVTPINIASNASGPPIAIGSTYQWGIAVTPSGNAAYLGNFGSNTLIPILTATNTTAAALTLGSGPAGIAITPDGSTAYVSNSGGNSLSPVALASGTVLPAIGVGPSPYPVAITPDQAPVASFSVIGAPAGTASTFNASASSVAYGSIATYTWNFGDGQSATTATPTVAHVYAAPGTYAATLTETDAAGTSLAQVFTGQTVSLNGSAGARTTRGVLVSAAPSAKPRISLHSLQLDRRGNVLVPITCPANAVGGCRGSITIRLAGPAPRAKRASALAAKCARGCRPLGSAKYEARAGQRLNVRVHMASFVRKLAGHRRGVRVTLTATNLVGAGAASTSLTLALHGRA